MKRNVEFVSKGDVCRGWLYSPDTVSATEPAPGIVMAHGFAGVKEMGHAGFAKIFATSGFATLVFDYRFWWRVSEANVLMTAYNGTRPVR